MSNLPRSLAMAFAIGMTLPPEPAAAADARQAAASDQRSRIVESSLKDLSNRNDAAISGSRISAQPGTDALGNPRVDLQPEPRPQTDELVRAEVESSLHRLRRETVSRQTDDGRQARVEETLDRAARDPD